MWNYASLAQKAKDAAGAADFGSLAQKAKDAAARLESQLDNSVGIDDGGGGGNTLGVETTSAAASGAAADGGIPDGFDDDDDFFAEDDNQVFNAPDDDPVAGIPEEEENVNFGGGGKGDGWDEEDVDVVSDEEDETEPTQDGGGESGFTDSEADLNTEAASVHAASSAHTTVTLPPLPPASSELAEHDADTYEGGEIETAAAPEEATLLSAEDASVALPEEEETPPLPGKYDDVDDTDANDLQEDTRVSLEHDVASPSSHTESTTDQPRLADSSAVANDPSPSPVAAALSPHDTEKEERLLSTIADLENRLSQREYQLASKAEQFAAMTEENEAETARLRKVTSDTKEEAKKRVTRARERVDDLQSKLAEATRRADSAGGNSKSQSEVVEALRAEGEALARKQSVMEQSVRAAKGEARDLAEQLQAEKDGRAAAIARADKLEADLKEKRGDLASARKGESRVEKLEIDLVTAKEESEGRRLTNLSLERDIKEMKESYKSSQKDAEEAKSGVEAEMQRALKRMRKERDDALADLEAGLQTGDREAQTREDALRREVSELRKRWQDAVRRAEDLSMDVQQSTAPLLRQLESAERQHRARASAWAELETKLRSDVEESVVLTERLTKERNDLRAEDRKSKRILKERDEEIAEARETIETLEEAVEALEVSNESLEDEKNKTKEEWVRVERRSKEEVAEARSDMMRSAVDGEERYRSRIEHLEEELVGERGRRSNLEKQLDLLAESVRALPAAQAPRPEREKALRSAGNQASLLHDALAGMDSDDEDYDDDEEDGDDDDAEPSSNAHGSFAAMEQLSQGLKGAKLELEALRQQLESSEETRESLVAELGETRQAAEKLPLFEVKVHDLTIEVNLKDLEIQGLRDDIADVRFLYRTQLDALLEEKMAQPPPSPKKAPSIIIDDSEA